MSNYGKLILEATMEEAARLSMLAIQAAQDHNLEEVLIQIGKMSAVLEKGKDALSRVTLSDEDAERFRNIVWLEAKTRRSIIDSLGKGISHKTGVLKCPR